MAKFSYADPNLNRYMVDISRHPIMSSNEFLSVARLYYFERGKVELDKGSVREAETVLQGYGYESAREAMIHSQLRLTFQFSSRYFRTTPSRRLLDIVQAGNEGLMDAVEDFNPFKLKRNGNPYAFGSYLVWKVRGRVDRLLKDSGRRELGNDMREIESLDVLTDDGDVHPSRLVPEGLFSGLNVQNAILVREYIGSLVEMLTPKQRNYVEMMIGLRDGISRTGGDIAEIIGTTPANINITIAKAKKSLRAMVEDHLRDGNHMLQDVLDALAETGHTTMRKLYSELIPLES